MTEIQYKSDMDVELIDSMGSDLSIVQAARVSVRGANAIATAIGDRDAGLINFLMRDRHGTPFEHNSFTFRVSAPLFVFHEFQRHRIGWSYNEESGRYRELDPVFYVPRSDRPLRQVGKPGAYTFEPGSYEQVVVTEAVHERAAKNGWMEYQDLLRLGVAKEVARNVLPVSIYKTMYATCNLRSLLSFLTLRRNHELSTVPTFPLAEIQMVAEALEAEARVHFPLAFEAFDRNGRVAP